jgi:hypothetical protein
MPEDLTQSTISCRRRFKRANASQVLVKLGVLFKEPCTGKWNPPADTAKLARGLRGGSEAVVDVCH